MDLLLLQPPHQFVGGVVPDFAERPVPEVPEGIVCPELIRVYVPAPVHRADPYPGPVASVHPEKAHDLLRARRILPDDLHIQVRTVRVVVHSKDLHLPSGFDDLSGASEDQVHRVARLLMRQVLVREVRASARIHEMVDAAPGDLLLDHQVEYGIQVVHVATVQREPQADFDPRLLAVPNPSKTLLERTAFTPESIVRGPHPVQAHPHVLEVRIFHLPGHLPGDQRSVRGDHGPEPFGSRIRAQFEQVLPEERFTTGEQQHRDTHLREIIYEGPSLLRGELPLERPIPRLRVTVHTAQIAPSRHIPDHDRLSILRKPEHMRRHTRALSPVTQRVRGRQPAAQQPRHINHSIPSMVSCEWRKSVSQRRAYGVRRRARKASGYSQKLV